MLKRFVTLCLYYKLQSYSQSNRQTLKFQSFRVNCLLILKKFLLVTSRYLVIINQSFAIITLNEVLRTNYTTSTTSDCSQDPTHQSNFYQHQIFRKFSQPSILFHLNCFHFKTFIFRTLSINTSFFFFHVSESMARRSWKTRLIRLDFIRLERKNDVRLNSSGIDSQKNCYQQLKHLFAEIRETQNGNSNTTEQSRVNMRCS